MHFIRCIFAERNVLELGMGKGGKDKPPTGSLYPRESLVCFFLFIVELAAVIYSYKKFLE